MKLTQLSVFLENRPGHLVRVCETLADAGINIAAMTLADTGEFGILRLMVREWEPARAALDRAGCAVNLTEVLVLAVPDEPGGLARVLKILDAEGIGIEYMYAFAGHASSDALIVMRCDDPDRALAALERAGLGGAAPF
jgi:hypothetical protein